MGLQYNIESELSKNQQFFIIKTLKTFRNNILHVSL